MGFIDPNISGARIRLRRSLTAGEAPADGELRPGEPAINAADGVMYVGQADGSAGIIPGATGITRIVALTESEYNALSSKDSTTLYVIQ